MRKLEKNKEIVFKVKTESIEDFFARGKKVAMRLDKGKPLLSSNRVIGFEDPDDLIEFLPKH